MTHRAAPSPCGFGNQLNKRPARLGVSEGSRDGSGGGSVSENEEGEQAQRVSRHPAATPRKIMAPKNRPTIRCRRYFRVNTRALLGLSGR